MRPDLPAFRRFPNPGWAWPRGGLDQLIRAAASADGDDAHAAFRTWLAENDIDDATFREHRLLAAIAQRFGKRLADAPEYPRLLGLQRLLWTKSRTAIAECLPTLRQLVEAGIPVMLLKGAARIALDPADQKARVSHDLDIVVPPQRLRDALTIMVSEGWEGSGGQSGLCLIAEAETLRGVNFFKGHFGDIDLHQWAYGANRPIAKAQEGLWRNAQPARFFELPVLVPSAADRIALAIHHSARDAHAHSDWVVDCARYVAADPDWDRLAGIVAATGSTVPAQVLLSYLRFGLKIDIPTPVLDRIAQRKVGPINRVSDLLQCRPRGDWGPVTRLARGLAKQGRILREGRSKSATPVLRGQTGRADDIPSDTKSRVFLGPLSSQGLARVEIELDIALTGQARRIEFELNSERRHIARLRFRSLTRRKGNLRLRFQGMIDIAPSDAGLWLEARPGRTLRGARDARTHARYDAIPFDLTGFRISEADRHVPALASTAAE